MGTKHEPDRVLVVDERRQFVGYVHPGRARLALKQQRVRFWKKRPPAVMLLPGETRFPELEDTMNPNTNANIPQRGGIAAPTGPMNWHRFFQEERELWIHNTSGTQLSISFEITNGHAHGVLIPVGSKPINLTNEVPFEAIKKSLDFRKFLTAVPPVLRLLTSEQADEIFAQAARASGLYIVDPQTGQQVPNIMAAMEQAIRERKQAQSRAGQDDSVVGANGQVRFSPPKTALELQGYTPEAQAGNLNGPSASFNPGQSGGGFDPATMGFSTGPVMLESIISPFVLNLCNQVNPQGDQNNRMPAKEFFEEIKKRQNVLTFEDLQYIESYGVYPTVKKWARGLQAQRASTAPEIADGLEGMLDLPPPPPASVDL